MKTSIISLILFVAASGFVQAQSEYICPPCSTDCHNLIFDGPGLCSVCSMELLNKNNINEGLAYTHIYPEEVCMMVEKNPDVLILDVRSVGEFNGITSNLGRLANAVNIPIQDIEERFLEIESYREKEIIVYCSISMRSPRVSKFLSENGFIKVKNMLGGMTTWNSAEKERVPCKKDLLVKN